jgi:hypothetical protein
MPTYSKPEFVVDDYAVIRARMDELGLGRSSPTQAPPDPVQPTAKPKAAIDVGLCDFCQARGRECDGDCGLGGEAW